MHVENFTATGLFFVKQGISQNARLSPAGAGLSLSVYSPQQSELWAWITAKPENESDRNNFILFGQTKSFQSTRE